MASWVLPFTEMFITSPVMRKGLLPAKLVVDQQEGVQALAGELDQRAVPSVYIVLSVRVVVGFPGMSFVIHTFQKVRPEINPTPGCEKRPIIHSQLTRGKCELRYLVVTPATFAHPANGVAAFYDPVVVPHPPGMPRLHAENISFAPALIHFINIRARRVGDERRIDQPSPLASIATDRLVGHGITGYARVIAAGANDSPELLGKRVLVEQADVIAP